MNGNLLLAGSLNIYDLQLYGYRSGSCDIRSMIFGKAG
jgi:hypothetical protein